MLGFPHIDVEKTFDELVRDYGTAQVLRDVLPRDYAHPNADYVFHSERVVAELKCLTEDNSDSVYKQTKLAKIINQNLEQGKIASRVMDDTTWKTFPLHMQRDISALFSPPIHSCTKKANIQIRETKSKLGMDSYSGLLIIANDGLETIPPAAFINTTQHYIFNNLHNIDTFIYLTVNLFTHVKSVPMPALFWMPMSMTAPPKLSDTFLMSLFRNWKNRVDKKWGVKSFGSEIRDEQMEQFWNARHYPKT